MRQNVGNDNWTEVVAVVPLNASVFSGAVGSSKIFVVPSNEVWKINYLYAALTSTATIGNRWLALSVADAAGNILHSLSAGIVQAASLVRRYNFMQGAARETVVVSDEVTVPLPRDIYLGPGYTMTLFDRTAVDVAADTTTVAFQYQKTNI